MKQTAMQLLLKEVTEARDISVDVNFRSALDFVRDTIEWDYLEKEKEQMCNFVEYCEIEHSKYQETEASWIKELTIDDLFEKRYTK